MKKIIIAVGVFLYMGTVSAQHTFRFTVRDSATQEALLGVTAVMANSSIGCVTDESGTCEIQNVPDGNQNITFSLIGYRRLSITKTFPLADTAIASIALAADNAELDEVVVSSARTHSRIEDLPQRVEVLGEADLLEESTIKPGNISSILGDISVIHIQQTSATNGNVAVRMQGLDGKYTQILRDGIPAFDGFSGSFDVMSIPPLDLRQVEIIKGAASTLYGGGAIAGLINLISKTPTDSNQYSFTANYSTLREANVNGFFSGRKKRFGFTMFAGTTQQAAKDVDGDGFSDVPKLSSYIVHPRLFIDVSNGVKLNAGYTGTYEMRAGGDMQALRFRPDSVHSYFEDNKIQRHTGDLQLTADFRRGHSFALKGAVNVYDRNVNNSSTIFHGRQITTYTEASYRWVAKKNTLIAGINFLDDNFKLLPSDSIGIRSYNNATYGIFAQSDWQVTKKFLIEPGVRLDYHSRYGFFCLPRLSLLIKPLQSLSIRLSGGTGYKTPNLFADKEYAGRLNNIMPLATNLRSEYSIGANADVNYHAVFFDVLTFELNQAFYYTHLDKPLVLQAGDAGRYTWVNASHTIYSGGSDTYIRLGYKHAELYIGYNHTTSLEAGSGRRANLTYAPQDKVSTTVVYEVQDKWRFGVEGSLIANQYIDDGSRARNYYMLAAMVERKIGKHWSIILNGENLLNVKQSSYQALYSGTMQSPVFHQLYAPIDGWVLNLCVQLKI